MKRTISSSEHITSRFRAHDFADKTAAENKRAVAPYMLAARPEREFWEGANWVQHKPGWLQTEWTEGDLVVEDKYTETAWHWAANLHANDFKRRPGTFTMRNLLLQPRMNPFYSSMRWGLRALNMPAALFQDVDCFANANSHGLYVSPNDDTTFDNCTFIRCGAQGIQVAYRPEGYGHLIYNGDNRPYEKEPKHLVRNSHFIDCGETGPSRSFALSYFNPGSQEFKGTVRVENCSFVEDYSQPFGYKGWKSTGALLVSPMQSNPILKTNMMDKVEVKNTLFDYSNGDRAIATIRATDEVVFEDCQFIARDYDAVIDINSQNPYTGTSACKRVILRNNKAKGNVTLRIFPEEQDRYDHFLLRIDVAASEGREIVIDCQTGTVLSNRPLDAQVTPEMATRIRNARKDYNIS